MKPGATFLRLLLWRLAGGLHEPLTPPPPGLVTVPAENNLPDGFYDVCGFRRCGARAVRIDMLERLSVELRKSGRNGPFELTADHMSLVGCSGSEFVQIVNALSYRKVAIDAEKAEVQNDPPILYAWQRPKRTAQRRSQRRSGELHRKGPGENRATKRKSAPS